MGDVILDMSISIDGCIARLNGDDGGLNAWVFEGEHTVAADGTTFQVTSAQSAKIFQAFVRRAGAFILGKRTFIAAGKRPIFGMPSFILTHATHATGQGDHACVRFVGNDIEHALQEAQVAAADKAVYIFGGAYTAQQYLDAGLVDEIHLNIVPILFGDGIRLFDNLTMMRDLERLWVVEGVGVTHVAYRVVKDEVASQEVRA